MRNEWCNCCNLEHDPRVECSAIKEMREDRRYATSERPSWTWLAYASPDELKHKADELARRSRKGVDHER